MSKSDETPESKRVSRRGFIAGVTVGATGAVLGREVAAQTIHLGNLDDLPPNWWELPDGWWNDGTPDVPDVPDVPDTPDPVDPQPPQPALAVRRNIYSLDPNGATVSSLRQGIRAMQARPVSDPTSWQFQSNIHGVSGNVPPGLPQDMLSTWETCRHANRFFLSWHRIYLYYFERILRVASGNPSLALPYWDYSVPGQSALPAAFRFPQDASNPLFRFERFGAGVNQGAPLPPRIVNTFSAMQTTFFQPPGFTSTVEQSPHNGVHVAIGGRGGLMTSPATAALDPIFWLHHCNVDRLWNRWIGLGGGRQQPVNDSAFMNDPYAFYDENRNRVVLTGRQVLDTASQLGYRYDDDPAPSIGASSVVVAALESAPAASPLESMTMSDVQIAQTPLTEAAGVSLGLGSAGVKLAPVPQPQASQLEGMIPAAPAEEGPVVLELDEIDFETPPGVWYDIYVNLPENAAPDPEGPYFAGTFTPFAQNRSESATQIDITGLLARQAEAGLFRQGNEVDVRFVSSEEPSALESVATPPVNIGKVRIVRP